MTSLICAARQIQRRQFHPHRYHECQECDRVLSIAEVIERHCEGCGSNIQPREVSDRRAAA